MSSKLVSNLSQLQNLVKRDPESYKDEFDERYEHCEKLIQMLIMAPATRDENFISLVMFVAQVSHCYPDVQSEFPQQLYKVLSSQGQRLSNDTRMVICKALIVMRNKGFVSSVSLLELFFSLLRCQDKMLRKTLYTYIVNDIKKVNLKDHNVKVNTSLLNFMCTMLKDSNPVAVKMSLDIMIELYRRKIWNDAKTVNAISTGLFSPVTKVLVASLTFFLGSDEGCEVEDSEDEAEEKHPKKSEKNLKLANRVAKKSKKRQKRMDRAVQALKKHKKNNKADTFNFSAIHLIYDPQELAEKLFTKLEASNEKFEIKMMMTSFISRLIGIHQLIVMNFYACLDRFLQPHRREVTKVLMFLAQASHEMVPPEIIQSSLKTIANNFITERNSGEVMAVGLNAIREVCSRCPLAMTKDLLDDFVLYKTHKNKGVSVGARSLINLYREKNPALLSHTDRGRPTDAMKQVEVRDYGALITKDYLPGAEVLADDEVEGDKQKEEDEWASCSEDEAGDSDGSWCDVSHSSDEETITAEVKNMNPEDKKERARNIVQSRILSQDDFKKIQSSQITKSTSLDSSSKSRKRPCPEEPRHENEEIVRLSTIEDIHKKRRHDRESRLETVMAGREGREKFTHGVVKMNPHASTSNVVKRKRKNFQMVKHKIKATKGKRSYHDKKVALTSALLKKMKSKR